MQQKPRKEHSRADERELAQIMVERLRADGYKATWDVIRPDYHDPDAYSGTSTHIYVEW